MTMGHPVIHIFYCVSNRLKLVCFVLFFCSVYGSTAQNPDVTRPKFRFQHLNIDLNNNMVEAIYQDSYGYIWIGTLGGVHKYDGINLTLYLSTDDTTTVSGDRVGSIFEDSKGRLWLGTESGICYYNREKDNFIRYSTINEFVDPADPTPDRIGAIVEDKGGTIWIGSERGGLHFLDEKKHAFVPFYKDIHTNALSDAIVISLFFENKNVLWVGTMQNGLFKLNTQTKVITQFKHDPDNPESIGGNYMEDILIDSHNNLWIATSENGLDKLEIGKRDTVFKHYKHQLGNYNSLFNNAVTTVYEDKNENIWVCNENGGLHLYDFQKDFFYRYTPDPFDPFSISNISVKAIFEDKQGRLWFGSNLEGIDVVDKYQFRFDHYFHSDNLNGLNNNIVRNILEDKKGNLWIATDGGGLNYFDRKNNFFTAYQYDPYNPKSISSNAVLSLCYDAEGKLWVGTWRGGINILGENTDNFEHLDPQNPNIDRVYYLLKDRYDDIWAGAQSGGINIFDHEKRKFINYSNDPQDPTSPGDDDITVVFEDSRGNIWLGTEFNGLNLAIKNRDGSLSFRRFIHVADDETSLPHIKVNHIFEDRDQTLWIATEGGLSKYLPEFAQFKNYSIGNGLESNHVKSIIEDDHGYLWMGTSKGISRFDKKSETFKNYTYHDGLQRGEFSRYSVCKTSRGELVFGGSNGFNIFYPDSIKDNPYPPEVYLTDFKIFNKSASIGGKDSPLTKHISETKEITLSFDESVFSFEYVALNFTNSQLNQYAYMMEGFDEDWNYVGTKRTATYTNLDPGKYTFKVIASNNDGVWNTVGRSIKINITPPFWLSWWFKVLIAILFVTLIYIIFYFRTRQLLRTNVELEEKVNDRTAQLEGLVKELREKQDEIKLTNAELKATLDDLYEQKKQVEKINNELDQRVQERTSRLVKANQELDRFVYSASHDLSAPLKSILGLINITMMQNKNRAVYVHLEHMKKSVLKLEDVIFHLTQFSRNMGWDIAKKEFAFGEVVNEVLDDLSYLIEKEKIKFLKDYNENETVVSDVLRIKIILTNLISNAIKYRDKYKSDPYIKIHFCTNDQFYLIEVVDNGIGIKPEYQENVFNMFFRGTAVSEGSGLGLYIVNETVEKLNGKLHLQSEPGLFTKFSINIPHQ